VQDDERFECFWAHYPRKVGKLAAQKVFLKLQPSDEVLQQMLDAIAWQKTTSQWTDMSHGRHAFVPHPTSWLRAGRWLDEPDVPPQPRYACPHEPRCEQPGTWRCRQRTALERAKRES